MSDSNVGARIVEAGRRHPAKLALSVPCAAEGYARSDTLSYGELLAAAAARQQALRGLGLVAGDRVLLLARPGLGLYVLMVALLASGIVPVLVDRGMSRPRLVAALRASGARVAIGERSIMRLWWLLPTLWRWRRFAIDGTAFGVRALGGGSAIPGAVPACVPLPAQAHGLITFTSGSTGAPKGADRTHGSLTAQHLAIRAHWQDRDDDIDMPSFPVLVLHNLCCGLSTVMPAVDLATPGRPEAARVLAQLEESGVTRLTGAPAFIGRLLDQAEAGGRTFPRLRSLVVGGATLPPGLAARCLRVFPQAECRVVYGSTEAEPIADVTMAELVADGEAEAGHLLGHPAAVAEVCLVDPAQGLAGDGDVQRARVGVGVSGEILVAGPHVLQGYVDNPAANAETKIPRADGGVWHRTGDVGHVDARGRLWLEGRVKDAVTVAGVPRHTLALEKALDQLPGIRRSALVQGPEGPALIIACARGGNADNDDADRTGREAGTSTSNSNSKAGSRSIPRARDDLAPGLRQRLAAMRAQQAFPPLALFLIDDMPVDGRHNSKLDRPALRDLLARGRLAALGEI